MKKVAYPIRAVARLTGVSIDSLRAWERRYAAVTPGREEGERVYHEADVQRLILLRKAVEAGHAISRLAGLSDRALAKIADSSEALMSPTGVTGGIGRAPTSPDLNHLHEAVARLDYPEIDRELNRLATLMPPPDLVHGVVAPLMSEVGDRWYRGELSVAQEHLVSASLRNVLGSLVRLHARSKPDLTIVFATPQGERHEFGILCGAMLAAAGGFGTLYLGVDLPRTEIVGAATVINASVVVLGMKAANSLAASRQELQRISRALPSSIALWVGGIQPQDDRSKSRNSRVLYLRDLRAFEQRLIVLGARF